MDWVAIICIIFLIPVVLSLLSRLIVGLSIRSQDKAEKKSNDEFEADWNKFMRK